MYFTLELCEVLLKVSSVSQKLYGMNMCPLLRQALRQKDAHRTCTPHRRRLPDARGSKKNTKSTLEMSEILPKAFVDDPITCPAMPLRSAQHAGQHVVARVPFYLARVEERGARTHRPRSATPAYRQQDQQQPVVALVLKEPASPHLDPFLPSSAALRHREPARRCVAARGRSPPGRPPAPALL